MLEMGCFMIDFDKNLTQLSQFSLISDNGWQRPHPMRGSLTDFSVLVQNAVTWILRPVGNFLAILPTRIKFWQPFARMIFGTGQVLQISVDQFAGGGTFPIRRHSSTSFPRK